MSRSGAAVLAVLLAGAVPARGERLPLRVLSTANGLLHNYVNVVRQDSRGLLWFGTEGGVSRFDGTTFRNYGEAVGLPEGLVSDVLETRSGEMLFATEGGVCRLLPPRVRTRAAEPLGRGLFACSAPGPSPEAKEVRVLHQDRRGELWVGTADGLYRGERRGGDLRLVRVPLGLRRFGPWNEGIRAIVEDPRGGLWLGTAVGVAYRAASGAVTQYRVSNAEVDDRVFALLLDRGGRLWIGHVNEGVFVWNPPAGFVPPSGWSIAAAARTSADLGGGAGRPIRLPEAPGEALHLTKRDGLDDERVRTGLLEDADGAIWIGTVRGLGRFHDGRLDRFSRRNGLPGDGVFPSLVDRAGNVWMGSASGGAVRLRRGGFTTYDEADGLRDVRIRSVFEGNDGTLYVLSAAERDYIHRFVDGRFEAVAPRLPEGLAYTGWWVQQVGLQDREGDWWLPTGGGVLRYPRVRRFADLAGTPYRAYYGPDDGLGGSDAEVLYEDRHGDIWVGTFDLGPSRLSVWRRSSGRFERFATSGRVWRTAPAVFREDAAGRLWMGLGGGTLGRFQGGRLIPVALPPRVGPIQDLHFDGRGRLWVATGGAGLLRLDHPDSAQPRVSIYGTAEGLAGNDVTCIVEDLQGGIYAGTRRGVDRLDPATGAFRHFGTGDGLANDLVRVAFRDHRGDLWFGTMQGLSRLRVTAEPRVPAARVLITGLEVAGVAQSVPETGVTRLEGPRLTASRVRIGFAAPSADQEVEPLYRYRLEGLDREWSLPTRDRAVNFAGLAPGRFRFAVQAVRSDGAVGPPARVDLTLLPPLWRRWWALAGLAALLAAAAYGLHRQRLARLLAIERVRTRIAADLHDDLGASLSRIAVLSEVASRRMPGDGGGAPELRQIAETARGLVDEASDIVWSIDPHHDDLGSLLVRLRRLAADLLGERGIALELSAPPAAESIRLSADRRRHLLLILKEAIHNAARHAGATRVEIRLATADHRLSAEVRDDGRGFEVRAPEPRFAEHGGRGLRNMHERARVLGGQLEVRSAPGGGTTLRLSVPQR